MLISIEPLAEEELDAFATVAQSAFVDGIGSVLLHGGAAANPTTHANLAKDQGNYFRNDPSTRYIKAVDTSTGDIVAVAKWNFYLREQTPEELDRSLHIPSPGAVDYVASEAPILKHLMGGRRQFMGIKPYIYLSILATDPKYHRRGAGGKLVEWAVKSRSKVAIRAMGISGGKGGEF
jgi:GNAT superfamily N-acetyltransferase